MNPLKAPHTRKRNREESIDPDHIERAVLAIIEAEQATSEAIKTSNTGVVAPPTPFGEDAYPHMLEEVRAAFGRLNDITIDKSVHERFAEIVGCSKHANTINITEELAGSNAMSFCRSACHRHAPLP